MNDLDRWVNLEGPPPDGVRELLDAACGVPDMTPELEERLERRLRAALAVDRRKRARQRKIKLALGGGLLAACFAGGIMAVVALRSAAPAAAATSAHQLAPSATEPISTQLMGATIPAPPLPVPPPPAVSATSRLPDTGPVRRPRKGAGLGLSQPR